MAIGDEGGTGGEGQRLFHSFWRSILQQAVLSLLGVTTAVHPPWLDTPPPTLFAAKCLAVITLGESDSSSVAPRPTT